MGLFQRREHAQTDIPYRISVGNEHTTVVVGLGNPGKKYDGTRHNIGFTVVDAFAEAEQTNWQDKKSLKCQLAEVTIGQTRVLLIKPTTFMNLSGESLQAVQHFYKLTNTQTIVVHDELDIAFGQIRTRVGGSAAGHNGIKSLIQHCGEDFGRVRIGIKNDHATLVDSADFVLQKFSKDEKAAMPALTSETLSILNQAIFGDSLATETRTFL